MSHRNWPGHSILALPPEAAARALQRERQVATAGQTVFDLTGGLGYTPGIKSLIVFVNGLLVAHLIDYLETSATRVTFLAGLGLGDEVEFVAGAPVNNTSSADASLVVYTPAGTGAVATNVQAKLRAWVNVTDFGAVSGGSAAVNVAAFAAAITHLDSLGGGELRVGPGTFDLNAYMVPCSNLNIVGAGRGATTIRSVGNPIGDRLISGIGIVESNLTISGITFVGSWLTNQSEAGSNGLITLTKFSNVCIHDCAFYYARFMTLNINNCANVDVHNNVFMYGVRDFCGVWGSPNVCITGNTFIGNDDDSVSISYSSPLVIPAHANAIVSNNRFVDTLGIKMQGPKNVTISGNVMQRMKGHGIWVGQPYSTGTDQTPILNLTITDNKIADVIDRQYFVDGTASSVNLRTYIRLDAVAPAAGGLAVVPGEINNAAGNIQSPYEYGYSSSGVANTLPVRANSGVIVTGNVCRRTLPPVANYSAWGYGQAFTMNGFRDTAVSALMLDGMGIDVRLPGIDGLLIHNNILRPGQRGISFTLNSQADRMAKRVVISNNIIEDCNTYGIYWPGSATVRHQDIVLEGNTIDCDPYFLNANRGSGGTWLAATTPVALSLPYLGGVVVRGNRIRNAATVIDQSGASTHQLLLDNLLFADAAVTGFSVTNKGIGTIPGIGNGGQWWLQYEDSDPTSGTYGQSLGVNAKNYSALPTTGKWLANTFVGSRVTSVAGSGGSQYVVTGWARKTTGIGHVLNTDWNELRTLTGT